MIFKDKSELEYVNINERIEEFRKKYKGHSIVTSLEQYHELKDYKYVAIIKCAIISHEGKVIATGYSRKIEGATEIDKTSFLENAETKAVGRALAMLGIGTTNHVASKEEVDEAKEQKGNIQRGEAKTKASKLLEQTKTLEVKYDFITPAPRDASKVALGLKSLGITKPIMLTKFNKLTFEEVGNLTLTQFLESADKELIIKAIEL